MPLLLALASTLCARAEFHLGSGPNSWERFVVPDEGEAAGTYVVVDAAGNVLREHPVHSVEEVGGGTFLAEYNYRGPDLPDMEAGVLQAIQVDPLVNLSLDSLLFARGGSIFHGHNTNAHPTEDLLRLIDGDPTSTRLILIAQNPLEAVPLIRGGVFLGGPCLGRHRQPRSGNAYQPRPCLSTARPLRRRGRYRCDGGAEASSRAVRGRPALPTIISSGTKSR